MEKRVRRSTAPIYLVGVVWLVLAVSSSHSMGMGDALLAAALSAVAFVVGKAVFPDKSYAVPAGQAAKETEKKEEKKPEPPKDPEVQKLLQEREQELAWMPESFVEIEKVFPMFRLSIDGLKDGMYKLMRGN